MNAEYSKVASSQVPSNAEQLTEAASIEKIGLYTDVFCDEGYSVAIQWTAQFRQLLVTDEVTKATFSICSL